MNIVNIYLKNNCVMSGMRVCFADKGRFSTSKNPEQAPDFKLFSGTGPDF